jgi:hypothetical protein
VEGNVVLDETGDNLIVEKMTGSLSIQDNSNYYSVYRVLIIKENTKMTQEENDAADKAQLDLQFDNIVAEGTITLKRTGVQLDGIFANQSLSPVSIGQDYSVDLSQLSLQFPLDRSVLGSDEEFTVITYVDGGFDYPLLPPNGQKAANNAHQGNPVASAIDFELNPNPASTSVNVILQNVNPASSAIITISDISGKKVKDMTVNGSTNYQIPVDNLDNGIYFVSIKANGETKFKKLFINK